METPPLSLTERERSTLDALTTDSGIRARRRALILLAWADGKLHTDIVHQLKSRAAQIRRVVTDFETKRLDSLSPSAIRRVKKNPHPKPKQTTPDLPAQSSMRAAAQDVLGHQFSKLKQVET